MDFEHKALLLDRLTWDNVLSVMEVATKNRSGFYTIECPCNIWYSPTTADELPEWYLNITFRLFPSKRCYSDDGRFQGDLADFVAAVCSVEEQKELIELAQSILYHCQSKKQKSLPFD